MSERNAAVDEGSSYQMSSVQKVAIVLFGFLHGVMLLVAIVPRDWSPHADLLPLLTPYQELTGTAQQWNMFYTIPAFASSSVKMTLRYPDGKEVVRGPVLPGLESVQTPKRILYYYVIDRMLHDKSYARFREGWEAKIAQQVEREGALSYRVEVENLATRNFFHITKDGKLTKAIHEQFGSLEDAE